MRCSTTSLASAFTRSRSSALTWYRNLHSAPFTSTLVRGVVSETQYQPLSLSPCQTASPRSILLAGVGTNVTDGRQSEKSTIVYLLSPGSPKSHERGEP